VWLGKEVLVFILEADIKGNELVAHGLFSNENNELTVDVICNQDGLDHLWINSLSFRLLLFKLLDKFLYQLLNIEFHIFIVPHSDEVLIFLVL